MFYDLFAQSSLNEPKILNVCLCIRILDPPPALEQKLILVICPKVFGKIHMDLKIKL